MGRPQLASSVRPSASAGPTDRPDAHIFLSSPRPRRVELSWAAARERELAPIVKLARARRLSDRGGGESGRKRERVATTGRHYEGESERARNRLAAIESRAVGRSGTQVALKKRNLENVNGSLPRRPTDDRLVLLGGGGRRTGMSYKQSDWLIKGLTDGRTDGTRHVWPAAGDGSTATVRRTYCPPQ